MTTLGFVCVQNAGRSQMATAFAERERARRGLEDEIDIVTGGTDPADAVHPEVVEAMAERDIDLSGRTPHAVTDAELDACDLIATMGCSTLSLSADTEVRDWALEDPHGKDIERVRAVRDEVEDLVVALFDEVEADRAAEQ
ncbi:MAG: low molecular weight phosphatase family protein [Haloglomus sp.]